MQKGELATLLTEINIDALVGPTHHFGGLGVGNVASHAHQDETSSPRSAALEGLKKAALVAALGVPQYVWLPPARPNLQWLQQLGFSGDRAEQVAGALHAAPRVLSAALSSAFMWAANSATVTPAADARDGQYHFTPANLISSWHRATEAAERSLDLRQTFSDPGHYAIHPPLHRVVPLRDEGAANHMRLCDESGMIGFNVFVHGADEENPTDVMPSFMPRHTRAASEAIARLHRLDPASTFFLHQHPDAISAGVFHNDVIATSHGGLLIHHEKAFLDGERELERLQHAFVGRTGQEMRRIEITGRELSLADAVQSYFFNSQILTPGKRGRAGDPPRMVLICPQQCRQIDAARRLVERLVDEDEVPVDEVHFVSLAESMAGGGGPACLRLRVPADQRTLLQMPDCLRLTPQNEEKLASVIQRYYPEELKLSDFLDPQLVEFVMQAPRELRQAIRMVEG